MKKNKTLLKNVKNFGPVTLAEFESIGLTSLEQIEELGFEESCRRYIETYPKRLNANAFLAILCALERTVWTQATPSQRAAAHRMTKKLKRIKRAAR
jgi:TfoX C-terminal domain